MTNFISFKSIKECFVDFFQSFVQYFTSIMMSTCGGSRQIDVGRVIKETLMDLSSPPYLLTDLFITSSQ